MTDVSSESLDSHLRIDYAAVALRKQKTKHLVYIYKFPFRVEMNYFWIPMDNDNIVRDFWHISSHCSQNKELDDKVLAVGHSSQTPLQFQCLRTWKWKVKVIINKWKYVLHLALKKIIFLNGFFFIPHQDWCWTMTPGWKVKRFPSRLHGNWNDLKKMKVSEFWVV